MEGVFSGRSLLRLTLALSTTLLLVACEEAMVVVPPEVGVQDDAARSAGPYVEDQVMVLPAPGSKLTEIAEEKDKAFRSFLIK